ncbi:isochorismatase family protein [Streptomyces himastatinicus]|nr:isochorismatase family protein [Streptomyces himastatinicus]
MVPFFVEANPYVRGIVPNIARIAEALRTADGLVAWVLPANEAPLGGVSSEFYGPTASEAFAATGDEGPLRSRLWHAFDVRADDLVVEKTAYSAFADANAALRDQDHNAALHTIYRSFGEAR